MEKSYPNAAYILSLVGGIFVILAGLLVALIGAAFTFSIGGLGGLVGLLGIIWGAIIIYAASQLRLNPSQHVTFGALILVFSLVSWIGALGGFFLGFILAFIGGILALAWAPPSTSTPLSYAAPPPKSQTSPARYCSNCGRSIPLDVRYCPYCGKDLG